MSELFRRLRYLLNRRRYDRELASDMEFHCEMAAREGARDPGNTLRLREEAREAWGWMWLERFAQDLRYAARMLRKSPGFTIAAVLMLAIGIGVNVAAFGFFNFVLWRPLPVRDPATLLRLERRAPDRYWSDMPYPEMAFFRGHSRTLSAFLAQKESQLSIEGESKPVKASFVTANFLSELGAPVFGRTFDAGRDGSIGAEPVAVLGHGFWERHFGVRFIGCWQDGASERQARYRHWGGFPWVQRPSIERAGCLAASPATAVLRQRQQTASGFCGRWQRCGPRGIECLGALKARFRVKGR